jgi:8-hydroxy-5-deazaflavin:NADPH oxidoreductase
MKIGTIGAGRIAKAFTKHAAAAGGQTMLDTTNALSFPDFKPLDLGGKASSEIVAGMAMGAKVVKAFNTVAAATLAADPRECGATELFLSQATTRGQKEKCLICSKA